jgi:hypothetical protein
MHYLQPSQRRRRLAGACLSSTDLLCPATKAQQRRTAALACVDNTEAPGGSAQVAQATHIGGCMQPVALMTTNGRPSHLNPAQASRRLPPGATSNNPRSTPDNTTGMPRRHAAHHSIAWTPTAPMLRLFIICSPPPGMAATTRTPAAAPATHAAVVATAASSCTLFADNAYITVPCWKKLF